jgi:hypothetical protein
MTDNISLEEHYKIARELESHHAIFERIWTMGRIRFSKKVPTAAVQFNRAGECVDFIVNRKFWEAQTFIQKCFVLSHECLHIALNHGTRSPRGSKSLHRLVNGAQDLVINHALVNLYGYEREDIDPELKYWWVDKTFKDFDPPVPDDENFEFYLAILKRMKEEQQDEATGESETVDSHGNPGDGDPQEGDPQEGEGDGAGGDGDEDSDEDTDGNGENPDDLDPDEFDFQDFGDSGFEDVIEDLNDELTDEEKETLENFVTENEGSDGADEFPQENPEAEPSGTTQGGPGGQEAGTAAGKTWTFAKKVKEPKKHKYESIVTSWAKKILKEEYVEEDQWVHRNRRYAGIEDTGLMLPTEYETNELVEEEDKIEVWFFQDTSGSCTGYTDRFFAIAEAMPLEKFNMRMFCFDTKVYETNLIDRKLYGFGGTYFSILEDRIQQEIKDNPAFRYPEAVFVVTDGYGNAIVPDKPKNWHWILTPDGSKECIPDTCNFHDLADYE